MPLSPAVIAEAALRIGDRDGPKAMTMRRIAGELGCDPMALYRHFEDRTRLLDAVADLALAGVADPGPRVAWRERLHGLLTAIRSAALCHGGIAGHVASRPPFGPNGRRIGEAMFAALTEAGLAPAEAVRAAQALVAYVASALAMAVQAGQRDARWHEASGAVTALPGGPPGGELPVVGSEEQFEYGLELMLTGIEVTAGLRPRKEISDDVSKSGRPVRRLGEQPPERRART